MGVTVKKCHRMMSGNDCWNRMCFSCCWNSTGNDTFAIDGETTRAAGSKTSKNNEKSHPEAAAAKTGSRNMEEIAPMSSQTPTSYSTLYTLGGLSRLLLTVCRGAYCITPILKHWRTCENDYHLCYTHVGGVVPKCVICAGGSILGVQFLAKNFSLIWSVGT